MSIEREIRYKFSATENVTSISERVHKSLKALRKSEGNEALEELMRLGRGAGALVAFELVSRGIERATEAVHELNEVREHGNVTGAHYVDAILKSIPGIGKVYEATRKLRFELDGTTAAEEKQVKSLEAYLKLTEDFDKRSRVSGKEGIDLARATARGESQDKFTAIARARMDATPEDAKKLDELLKKEKVLAKEKLLKIEKDYYDKQAKVIADGEGKIRELKATADAQEQRNLGQNLSAMLIEFRSNRDQQIRQLVDDTNAKLKDERDPARRQSLLNQRGEQARQIERAKAAKELGATDADRLEKEQRRFSFAEKGIEFLKKEGELGNAAADIQSQKLEIATEYAKKQAEINELLRRENILPDERQALQGLLGALGGQRARALARVGVGTPNAAIAPLLEGQYLSGRTVSARADNDPAMRTASNTSQLIELFKQMLTKMEMFSVRGGEPQIRIVDFR